MAAAVALSFTTPAPSTAQTCSQDCGPGETLDPIAGCCVPVDGSYRAPASQTRACMPGQTRMGPEQACCWPGQVFVEGVCRGVPSSCPAGFHRQGETCQLDACGYGRTRAQDGITCCYPGQVAADGRCRGIPSSCPANHEPVGETCSRERYDREVRQREAAREAQARREADARRAEQQRIASQREAEARRARAQAEATEAARREAQEREQARLDHEALLRSPYYLRRRWVVGFGLPLSAHGTFATPLGLDEGRGGGGALFLTVDRHIRFRGLRRLGREGAETIFGVDVHARIDAGITAFITDQPAAIDPESPVFGMTLQGSLEARARVAFVAPLVFVQATNLWVNVDGDPDGASRASATDSAFTLRGGFGVAVGNWANASGPRYEVSVRVAPIGDGDLSDVEGRFRVHFGGGVMLGLELYGRRYVDLGLAQDWVQLGMNVVIYPRLP
ncbi:MAG: hypothetical protein R3B40_09215 [Polyangiales bacterium]|nr:hypothetical protein [Myxococcales bacterium]